MSDRKNRIIDWFTFLVNGLVAISLIAAGWFLSGWYPSSTDVIIGNSLIVSGLILLVFYFYVLKKKTYKLYASSILITVVCMVSWILFEGSMDVAAFLPFYLLVFIPLSIYKSKFHK